MQSRSMTGAALSFLAAPALAFGQWPKAAGADALISDGAGSEVQAKLAAGADGSTYLSYYDSDPSGSPAFGFDVVLQRLDPAGNPTLGAGGLLIADRGYSSTQDYGLDAGPSGFAFLAFRDDRFAGDQITAARVSPSGAQSWGPTGVQLTDTAEFVASPKIAGLADGGCVVAWTQGSTVRLQRLDETGAPQWGPGVALPVAPGATASLSDLRRSDGDAVILSWVAQSGGFLGPRNLWTQKLDGDGAPQWPGTGVPVFTSGSLQFGNFPSFTADGAGGAVFAWYGTGPLQCYAQRVGADGVPQWGVPGTGVELSTDATQIRVSPSLAWDPVAAEAFAFWVEQSSNQALRGVWGQKLDAGGQRQWGASGIAYVPLGSEDPGQVRAIATDGGATALWFQGPGFGQETLRAVRVDGSGATVHGIVSPASTPSSKDDLAVARGAFGDVVAAWHGDPGSDDDVFACNLLADGSGGPLAGAISSSAGANVESFTALVGPLGGTLALAVDAGATGHGLGWVLGYASPALLPFGSAGDVILVDVTGPELFGLPVVPGPLAPWVLPIPNDASLCGRVLYAQGVHIDPVLAPRLTNAAALYLGL